MADTPSATPFEMYSVTVPQEWTDYNGHMHDATYATAFSDANEELFAALGLSADYRKETGNSYYTVELTIRYLAECHAGEELTASTVVLEADRKRLRLATELIKADGTVAATGLSFYLHVDGAIGKVCELSDELFGPVEALRDAHADIPVSDPL